MKFQIGDKVIIGKGNHSKVWLDHMNYLNGTVVTIDREMEPYYHLTNDFYVKDDDIEGLA